MKKTEFNLIRRYLSEQGVLLGDDDFEISKRHNAKQAVRALIDKHEYPLIKVTISDVEVEEGRNVPSSFLAYNSDKVSLIRRLPDGTFKSDTGELIDDFTTMECFEVRSSFRYADPATMTKTLVKRTPAASLLILTLVIFVMASPMYSNIFNSRLVFGESVSSLLVVSGIFILIFAAEYFLKEWIMHGLNRQIEDETIVSEDVLFNKVSNSQNKDAIVHWKTATESVVQIWRAVGQISLDAITALVIMAAFVFLLGKFSIFPIAVYLLFFGIQLHMKLKMYQRIITLNQLKDQKLTYLIGMERAKRVFKFLNIDRIRSRWMTMTNEVSSFNLQIQDHEEKSSGVLKFYSSASIIIIFIAAYFAIQSGDLEQSAVIALMLLNGRCSGAITAMSSRIYHTTIAYSKMKGAIQSLHEEVDNNMNDGGVMFTSSSKNTLVATSVSVDFEGHEVLSKIDLSLLSGTSLCLIGVAGSGKSTLLKVLAGLMTPTSGRVLVNNIPPTEYDRNYFRKNVAYYCPEERFIGDTLAFNSTLKYGDDLKSFFDALKDYGANFALNHNVIHGDVVDSLNLSSGQYQLLKMISSIGKTPDVIILDEPCSNLSPIEGRKFMTKLRERHPNAIIIYATHSTMLANMANFVLDMNSKTITKNK